MIKNKGVKKMELEKQEVKKTINKLANYYYKKED